MEIDCCVILRRLGQCAGPQNYRNENSIWIDLQICLVHSPVKESILYPRASDHSLRCGKGQLNQPHPLQPIPSDMGLDSITQTLSNPDCGLSKPHIPDNTPYISHRLIHSNKQGPHPQIYHMTCLSFSLTMATICLHFLQLFVAFIFLSFLFHLLSPFIQFADFLSLLLQLTLSSSLLHRLSIAVPRSLTALLSSLQCEMANYRG